jgi:hypothetical protein
MIFASPARRRYAERLVEDARGGGIDKHEDHLRTLVTTKPREAVELLAALTELVARQRKWYGPSNDSAEHQAYLRAAHAAYNRGERFLWVVDGELEYQRNKKRRQDARRKAARLMARTCQCSREEVAA